MSPRRHLDDLFSAAYEDELTPIEEARFQSHIQSCAPCAAAYEEFRATIAALHEVPQARMPRVVHLPSTPPVAERSARPRIRLSWFNLGLIRRFPATAIAGAAAVVLVIVGLTHGTGAANPTAGSGSQAHGAAGPAVATPAAQLSCVHSIVTIAGATPPPSFNQEDYATDRAQPAVRLVLAAPTLVVTSGKSAVVYAQLSAPVTSISNPGSQAAPAPPRAVLPCVSITVGSTGQPLAVGPASPLFLVPGAPAAAPGLPPGSGGAAGPIFSFQVPSGLPAGTEIHVKATIPVGYTGPGSAPLTAELTLTTG